MSEVQVPGTTSTPPAPPIPPVGESGPIFVLPKATSVLSEAWEVYKTNFKLLMKIYGWTLLHMLYIVGPIVLLYVVGQVMVNSDDSLNVYFVPAGIILGVVVMAAIIYLSLRMQVGLIMAIKRRREQLDARTILKLSKPFIFKYLWTSFIVGLVVFLGFVALIIPGIYLAVATSLVNYIVVDEGKSGWEAGRRSKEMIRGNWWTMVKYIGLSVGVTLVLSFAPLLILPQEAASIVNGLVSILIGPLMIAYTYLVYEAFKKLKPELNVPTPPQS